ncbi:Eco57I restriction-modification methylase domain-containing protein [Pseudomonas sp. o96-267]|uniref:Eco57I restriction-modification methylase domain-containing protein n=1 Tax=Pseudomonas sp. o96-267 TaxID=2479853 RepID=UPI001C498E33|nr:DNA methyltransferase [Pseudomonas sp. o96-267]
MLFARFLEQNHLLMYDPHTALTLEECQELAADEGCANGWELAGKLASRMLPQVFRADSPALAVPFAFNHVRALEKLIADLDEATFHAADSLGWVYQYWQAKKKDEVNASGVKIGADELSPVTQLFTEPYMVQFLLDNSLGAWWVTHYPQHRDLLPLTYLRTVSASAEDDSSANAQVPAAGTFDGWPQNLAQFKMLDPCCGSGHFLVATLLMLVPMRMAAENLSADQAIDAVISQNLHGLELDQRCVELAAFAVALEAWRYPGAGGYRNLPVLNIACVGQRIQTPREQWLTLAGDNPELKAGMARLYDTFCDAPILGSLIDPARSLKGDLLTADWRQVQPLLSKALKVGEAGAEDLLEAAITAQGLALAAELLGQKYQLVITNVPYLGREGHASEVVRYADQEAPDAAADLATLMLNRCLILSSGVGYSAVVLPQNWWVGKSYGNFRERMLSSTSWKLAVVLGEEAWQSFGNRGPNTVLLVVKSAPVSVGDSFWGLDVSTRPKEVVVSYERKISLLSEGKSLEGDLFRGLVKINQVSLKNNSGSHISFAAQSDFQPLSDFVISGEGSSTGDGDRFALFFWELKDFKGWVPYVEPGEASRIFADTKQLLRWEAGQGELSKSSQARIQNTNFWSRKGFLVGRVRGISAGIFNGGAFTKGAVYVAAKVDSDQLSVLTFLRSQEYENLVRERDPRVSASTSTLTSVPFDKARWSEAAAEAFPEGLPRLYSVAPAQWAFHGHPQPATEPLQVAVARLLGYCWPAESDTEMELSDEARDWIARCVPLNALADDDGIVCLSPLRGERAAADQLENLLHAAFGDAWTPQRRNQLLEQVGAKSLDAWLRDKFFEQHCKLFHHRPFVWHVWDGLKDGFSALVNYHKLDRNNLERLTYTYLDTWISNQQRAVSEKVDGADARLAAAQDLKARLVRILEGEAPYDIFVRWKPLEQQPIGWNPDLNDGVRLNIRPFMTAEVLRHNKKPKLNIEWKKDRGNDVPSAPWYTLGLEYGEKEGARINDHHLTLAEKKAAQK